MTKAAKTKTAKPRPAPPPAPVAIPPGAECLMAKPDLLRALQIGERKFDQMLSAGEFPVCDLRIGVLPRWRVGTLNRWIEERSKGA